MAADPSGFALLQSREDRKKLEVIPGLKEYIEVIMSLQREQNDTYTFSSPEPLSVGGHEAYYLTYQYLVGENKVTGLVTFIETDSGFYRITLLCDTNAVAEYKKEYDEIVSSFKELETANKTS
jgi:hypothetical protein